MTLANRLSFQTTLLFTFWQDDQDGVFVKWRVENSWGEDHGHKGKVQLLTQRTWDLLYSSSLGRRVFQCRGFVNTDPSGSALLQEKTVSYVYLNSQVH